MGQGKNSCCTPERDPTIIDSGLRPNISATALSLENMISLPGGEFLMGSEGSEAWAGDGEGPIRQIEVGPFHLDACAVTNRQFAAFVAATGYVTETERFGWSFVHFSQLTKAQVNKLSEFRVAGLEWWYRVDGTQWRQPLGPGRSLDELQRWEHPVVHVTWHDAEAYAHWAGKRLPTEAEWEYASRAGLKGQLYPWGNELTPQGKHRCNIWQGTFPRQDLGQDGYKGTAPARSFKPNDFGFYNMTGNTWEWVADWFSPTHPGERINPKGPPIGERKTMKGGSYLCHASYCNRYRCAARTSNTPDSSTGHLGFRCAADVA